MSCRHAFLCGLAALHLFLAACGSAGVQLLPRGTTAWKWLQLYGEVSGVNNQFGFFAPAVGFQSRALFTFTDHDGRTWEETHKHGLTFESNLRLSGLTDSAWAGDEEPDMWQVRSWAASALGRNPTAVKVDLAIQSYRLPSMAEYRRGQRPSWGTIFQTTFTRGESGDGVEDVEGDVETPTAPARPPAAPARKGPRP